MKIELFFGYTLEDIREYHKQLPRLAAPPDEHKSTGSRKQWLRYWGWPVLVTLAMLCLIYFRAEQSLPANSAEKPDDFLRNWFVYLIILGAVWFPRLRRLFTDTAKQAFQQDPTLAEIRRVVATDDGVSIEYPTFTTMMTWSHFNKLGETPSLFVLMASEQDGWVIPKRAFPSPEQLNEFRTFALAQIGNRPGGFPVIPADKTQDQSPSNVAP